MPALLLDTCAIIFLAERRPFANAALTSVVDAALGGDVMVSPVSAWEIGLLALKRGLQFAPDPKSWFLNFLSRSGVRLVPLAPEAAIGAASLPPPLHGDPADRLLVATARHLNVPIVTRDRKLLAYAKAGHVKGIAC